MLAVLLLVLVPHAMQFFFEDHVDFAPMLPHWQSTIQAGSSLATSFKMFFALRQQGLRAHSWV